MAVCMVGSLRSGRAFDAGMSFTETGEFARNIQTVKTEDGMQQPKAEEAAPMEMEASPPPPSPNPEVEPAARCDLLALLSFCFPLG